MEIAMRGCSLSHTQFQAGSTNKFRCTVLLPYRWYNCSDPCTFLPCFNGRSTISFVHYRRQPLSFNASPALQCTASARLLDNSLILRWMLGVPAVACKVDRSICYMKKHPSSSNFALMQEKGEEEKEVVIRDVSRQFLVVESVDNVAVVSEESNEMNPSLLAKLGQSVNIPGTLSSIQVIIKEPQLILPHVSVPDISWIKWDVLRQRGLLGVVFDKDNTLTLPYENIVMPSLSESLQECVQAFGGRVAVLSNSAGLQQFDPSGLKAQALESSLGISVIRHRTKKPLGAGEDLVKHFGCDPSLLVMVGDRCLTDIVYGNKNGMLTIHTALLSEMREPLIVSQMRKMEDKLVKWLISRGTKPPIHSLMYNKFELIKDPGSW